MTRAFPDYMTQKKDLLLLQNIASYLLLACGVIYVISVRYHHSSYYITSAYSLSALAYC